MTDKKKVLYVITKGNWGGAQRYVFDLATSLPRKNFETKVAVGDGAALPEKLQAVGVPTVFLPDLGRDIHFVRELKSFFRLWRLFRKERPAIIHLNSSKIGGLGALAAHFYSLLPKTYYLKPKIIFTAHGWAFNEERPPWQKSLIKFLQWLTVLFSHQTIVLSDREGRQMAGLPGTKKKLTRIYNGVGQIPFKDKDAARRELSRRETRLETKRYKTWLGTVAELHKNKGLDLAIEAAAQVIKTHNDFVFILIGDGEEKENLSRLIAERGLTDTVFLLGRVDEAQTYLKAFDVFILPSRKEGLPYVILEAGLAGLPVVATSVGGLPEIIKNNAQGLLNEPGDTESIGKSVELLLDDAYLKHKLGVGLQAVIRQKFSLEDMLKRTVEVYRT